MATRAHVFTVGEVRLSVRLPKEMTPAPRASVDEVTWVKTLVHSAWRAPQGAWAELHCARTMSNQWLPGAEATVLQGAMAKTGVRLGLTTIDLHAVELVDGRYLASYSARAGEGAALQVRGVHQLGFSAGDGGPLMCTLSCAGSAGCEGTVKTLQFEGLSVQPPTGGAWFQGLVAVARHPRVSAASALLIAALMTTYLLRRRRRPVAH